MAGHRTPFLRADERTTLHEYVRYLREAVLRKAEGLDDGAVRRPLVPTARACSGSWPSGEVGDRSVADVLSEYRRVAEVDDGIIAGWTDLDALCEREWADAGRLGLRWVLVHLVEETGRHAGHADIRRAAGRRHRTLMHLHQPRRVDGPRRGCYRWVNLRGVRILVVDDHPDVRHLLELDLVLAGYEVVTAGSFAEAERAAVDVDVLVADRFLDDGDGDVLARTLGLPTVLISGSIEATRLVAPRTVHLPKPFRPCTLVRIVEELAAEDVVPS